MRTGIAVAKTENENIMNSPSRIPFLDSVGDFTDQFYPWQCPEGAAMQNGDFYVTVSHSPVQTCIMGMMILSYLTGLL